MRRLQDVPLGFNPDGVFQARVSIPPTYRSPGDVARFYEQLANRLQAMPGVRQLGVISVAPLSGLLVTVPFSIAGESTGERDRLSANLRAISPGYLETPVRGCCRDGRSPNTTQQTARRWRSSARRFPIGCSLKTPSGEG